MLQYAAAQCFRIAAYCQDTSRFDGGCPCSPLRRALPVCSRAEQTALGTQSGCAPRWRPRARLTARTGGQDRPSTAPAASMAAASAAAPSPRPPSSAPSPRLRRDCRLSISLCIVKRGRGENMLFAPLLDWACNLSERPYRAAPRLPRPPSQCVAWQCRGATDGGRGTAALARHGLASALSSDVAN